MLITISRIPVTPCNILFCTLCSGVSQINLKFFLRLKKMVKDEQEKVYRIREPSHLPKNFEEYEKRENLKNLFGLKNPIYSLRNNALVKDMLLTQDKIETELMKEIEPPSEHYLIKGIQEDIDKFSAEVLIFSEALLRDSHTIRTMTPDLPFYINTRERRRQRMDIRQRAEVAAELSTAVPIKATDSRDICGGNADLHFTKVDSNFFILCDIPCEVRPIVKKISPKKTQQRRKLSLLGSGAYFFDN